MLTDKTLQDHNYRANESAIINHFYGHRVFRHPDTQHLFRYYSRVLDPLMQTGELIEDQHSYRLAPKAIATLAAYEEDDRRRRDQRREQALLLFLTFCLVGVGPLQAYVTAHTAQ